jgi:nitrogen fixation/metabolism regulation signal transduction histidine kinase
MADARLPVALTRLGFRRDVRLFLGVLVGFLIVIVLLLLAFLADSMQRTRTAVTGEWQSAADSAADEISAATDLSDLQARVSLAMTRHDIAGIRIDGVPPRTWGITGAHNYAIKRQTRFGPASIFFDETLLTTMQQRFAWTLAICLLGVVAGAILLALYLPRITNPIEQMLADAEALAERPGEQEETAYLIQTFRDTIDRLRSQEADLKRMHEEEKMRADELELVSATMTRSLTSGFISIGPSGTIVQLNAAAREMLDIATDEPASGRRLSDVIGDADFARILESAAATGDRITREEIVHGAKMLGLATVPVIDTRDTRIGTLALFTDLTLVKNLETRVRTMQALADLGEMSAGIAHEFRNSLTTILGYLKLARREALPGAAETRIAAAAEEANVLSAAVHRLLAFASPVQLSPEPVNISELARSIADHLEASAPDVEFRFSGDELMVDADRALIARAIENVIRNAVEAVAPCDHAKRVEIRFAPSPPVVTIVDNGVGLDASDAARVFVPFQSRKPGGFGLGLSLTRKIMLLHGGDVELRGAPGQGATVTLTFPAA